MNKITPVILNFTLTFALFGCPVFAAEPTSDSDFAPDQTALPVPPPPQAIVLLGTEGEAKFASMAGGKIDWPLKDGVLTSTKGFSIPGKINTNHIPSLWHFRDADIHVEFMLPSEGTGNSGIYIHGNYELQILNSTAAKELTQKEIGSVYGFAAPLVNACRKPGEWQVYDIRYRAPRRNSDGKIVKEGSITAWLNGKKVQDNTRFGEPRSNYHPFRYGTTPYLKTIGAKMKREMTGPVFLQDHSNAVRFRNVWLRPLDDKAFLYKPESVDVYLLGGQSNMQGIGKIAKLPADITKHGVPHTFYWNGKEFEPFVLNKTKSSTRAGEFGPEVGFALETATKERPVYLIKYHASGMPLHHGWNGNQWVGTDPGPKRRNFYAGEDAKDLNQGTLYAAMTKRFQEGMSALEADGKTPQVCGFIWMQGEQDSKHEVSATSYATSLKRLRNRLQADMAIDNLPLVFGQVLPHEPALERFTHRKEIRAEMAAADADSGSSKAIANAKMVSTDGFGLLRDTVHYNAMGQLKLGQAFATTLKTLQEKTK